MIKIKLFKKLIEWDKKGKYVFTTQELREVFGGRRITDDSFQNHARGFVKDNVLVKAYRGIYVNPDAYSWDGYIIEHIAKALRPKDYIYVSLESILSEYGVISQIPVDRITIATTGKSREFITKYGVIEFTKIKKIKDMLKNKGSIIEMDGRPLSIASKWVAYCDLKSVGRNLDLVNLYELNRDD